MVNLSALEIIFILSFVLLVLMQDSYELIKVARFIIVDNLFFILVVSGIYLLWRSNNA